MVTNQFAPGRPAESKRSANRSYGLGAPEEDGFSSVIVHGSAIHDPTNNRSVESADSLLPFEQLGLAREVIRTEGQALLQMADGLGSELCAAADLVFACRGTVIVCGMGKAGIIGQKVAATLASTGTRSHFVHPGEAVHGDLGRILEGDVVLLLSFSGRTNEVLRLFPALRRLAVKVIAFTGQLDSPLARAATITLGLGTIREACPLGLAPSTSTTCMLALGDALAFVVSKMKHHTVDDFALNHPGGSLGRQFAKVEDVMRPVGECHVVSTSASLREAIVARSKLGVPGGPIIVVDDQGLLTGIFTDSDLAHLLDCKRDDALNGPITAAMTHSPPAVAPGTLLSRVCNTLAAKELRALPVVIDGRPVGLVDIATLLE